MRYQQWQEKLGDIHLEMLRGSYANEVFGAGSDDLVFESSPAFSRIMWTPPELSIEDLDYMMDHIRDIVLKNNYYIHFSDERNEIFDAGVKMTIYRHNLKPSADARFEGEELIMPQFGNIYIEHRYNSHHNGLCISANYYNSKPERSFENLMELLLR